MSILRKAFGKGFRWKFEVFKMGIYIYVPILVWYTFNCDFGQKHFVLPIYKKYHKDTYYKLTLEDDIRD